jgi:YggT family protein
VDGFRELLFYLLTAYLIVLAGRAILSWFPVQQGTFLASLASLLVGLTEPVLRPVRRVIPPAGMLDTSFIVVFFVVLILQQVVRSG